MGGHDTERPAERSAESWIETVSGAFVPLELERLDGQPTTGVLTSRQLRDIGVAHVRARPHRVRRTDRTLRQRDPGVLKLSMPLSGSATVVQNGKEARLGPLDLALYDTGARYELEDRTGSMLVLVLPRDHLTLPPAALDLVVGRTVSGRHGLGGLLSPMLEGLARAVSLDEPLPESTGAAVGKFVRILFAERADRLGFTPADPAEVHRARVVAHIRENLADPDLSPDSIARACHLSTGHLHRLFRDSGATVAGLVRDRRLERCRDELVDPAFAHLAVAQIARRWSFSSAAHFSRAFRTRFGLSPSEARHQARGPATLGSGRDQVVLSAASRSAVTMASGSSAE